MISVNDVIQLKDFEPPSPWMHPAFFALLPVALVHCDGIAPPADTRRAVATVRAGGLDAQEHEAEDAQGQGWGAT